MVIDLHRGTARLYGVPGNEWFVREEMKFYAPAPVSVTETDDTRWMVSEDLVGKALMTPTLFEQAGVLSYVSLNPVYRRADIFTTIEPIAFVSLMIDLVHGEVMESSSLKRDAYSELDEKPVPKLIDAINTHGLPAIQVVYSPGIDLYTHLAPDALASQVEYLETITDPAVGQVLDRYRTADALDRTFILIVADHGHTPVLKENALGSEGTIHRLCSCARPVSERANPSSSRRRMSGTTRPYSRIKARWRTCTWPTDRPAPQPARNATGASRPGSARKMPAVRAFDYVNRTGTPIPRLKGTLDLIFARRADAGRAAAGATVRDLRRKKLVPIYAYLRTHPRPDLLKLNERMALASAPMATVPAISFCSRVPADDCR